MNELFSAWLNGNYPDLIVDGENKIISLMRASFEEGYETGKVDKIDSSNNFVCDFSEGCDGCVI